jgi:prepilin-type N-terminal cleavage/methylation domain-containing protein
MVLKLSLKQRGDTIVEVLFAVVVIGIVLTGAYAVVTHSVQAEQDAQEHSYALGLVQSQIEQLRAYVLDNSSAPLPFNNQPGCMFTSGSTVTPENTTSPDCTISASSNSGAKYSLNIALSTNGSDGPIYQVSARWTSLFSGTTTDQIKIPYRVN